MKRKYVIKPKGSFAQVGNKKPLKYYGFSRCGGRLTKVAGQVASCAPAASQVANLLGTSASIVALKTALILGGSLAGGNAYAGSCAETTMGSGVWACTGPAAITDITEVPTSASGGALTVTTGAGFALTPSLDDAIRLENGIGDTSITFTDSNMATIMGGGLGHGIRAAQEGNGALTITTTGTVGTTGAGYNGIDAVVLSNGTDMTISAHNVDSDGGGISAGSNGAGSGSITITTTGTVTADSDTGIRASLNNYNGQDVTVSAVDVTAGAFGIIAENYGTGSVNVTTTGAVSGAYGMGIRATDYLGYGENMTVTANDVSGSTYGIYVGAPGSGAITVTSTGTVSGGTGAGISASGYYNATGETTGTDMTITAVNVSGGTDGITALHDGSGDAQITVTGTVTGGSGSGIRVRNVDSAPADSHVVGAATIVLNAGANVSSSSGQAITNDDGDSTTTVNSGAVVAGSIVLGGGADNLTFSGGDFSAVTTLDGGADTDTLTFSGSSGALAGAGVTGWEDVVVGNGATISFSDNMLSATRLSVSGGGTLNAMGGLNLTGNLSNGGTINAQDGATGDSISVSGNFVGSGSVMIDVDFATDTSDTLVIGGDVSGGSTSIQIADVSSGVSSGNDVLVVEVQGTTAEGDFQLAGGAFASGAFSYDLVLDGAQYLLRGVGLSEDASVYETALIVLNSFNQLSTFSQRTLGRTTTENKVGWLRVHGRNLDAQTESGGAMDTSIWGVQAGADFSSDNTPWVFGVTVQYGDLSSGVTSEFGNGKINSTGYGIGATATWLDGAGTYLDIQGQVNWLDSDFASGGSNLATGQSSTAYALSVEAGKTIVLSDTISIVPQAQLIWGQVNGGSFTDSNSDVVNLGTDSRLTGRIGASYELVDTAEGKNLYVVGNILHDFSGSSTVSVGSESFSAETAASTWAEIGVGGSYGIGKSELFGEAAYRTSFDGASGNNKGLSGTVGLRVHW
ncbi:outer membrane autotransporter barrel domain-containing protein [Aliiroseovarius halocynthiae]|uniref:Autotransporter outer membrane beta-barrel domain-containing protein n=1 Tax=Aliiroseovarius halocynthiae TaxID=985055 RepID=A0A545SKT1_9RHOB|nr:autotransporter outer membrane beta-barrel domain-containing protein [Aliiroseovarius halocynthiae]TQV65593.1 autotransporter outer membrane beta-barrel domain-containing protein [Aliiroseovarius halocynthiae]SMR84129.1 outer membrane autotransporter barrel domain-containing protein [Aliiroseovarius halocynthiae]